MNLGILKKWVRALRSKKYKQGQYKLKTLNGEPKYCCLAVLCDLHAKATGNTWEDGHHRGSYLGNAYVLPRKVMRWAGLKSDDPVLFIKGTKREQITATCLNDHDCESFPAIATHIEQAQKKKLI